MKTETIYVYLPDEAIDVWAPVDAEHVLEGTCLAGWAPRPSIATVTLGPERRRAPCGTIV